MICTTIPYRVFVLAIALGFVSSGLMPGIAHACVMSQASSSHESQNMHDQAETGEKPGSDDMDEPGSCCCQPAELATASRTLCSMGVAPGELVFVLSDSICCSSASSHLNQALLMPGSKIVLAANMRVLRMVSLRVLPRHTDSRPSVPPHADSDAAIYISCSNMRL